MAGESYWTTVTIASGAAVSSAFDVPFSMSIGGVLNDSGWDASDMQLQVSRDGTNFLTYFDAAASASANTLKIANPAVSTFHMFSTSAVAGGPLLFMPIGGLRHRIHVVTAGALTDLAGGQTAARTLKVLFFSNC